MKKIIISTLIVMITISLCSCSKNKIPEVVKNTPGYEKWETKIDYSNMSNWLNVPETVSKEVDVIYFYPTCYSPKEGSNEVISEIDDAGMRAGAQSVFSSQASIFDGACNIYAPYYRQLSATYALTLTDSENDELFTYAVKQDAKDALDYYFENYNNGRPFFLAGHSQGSETLLYLLKDYFKDHKDYYDRMVAAYIIGYAVTESFLEENPHLKFATSATDTGVIISYNTEGVENSGKHNAVLLEGSKCINPINWKTDSTYGPYESNLGSRINGVKVDNIADAYINVERGALVTNASKQYSMGSNEVIASIFGPASYHGNDYALYYYSLKQNVLDRMNAYLSK